MRVLVCGLLAAPLLFGLGASDSDVDPSRNRFNNVKTNTWPSGMSHGGRGELNEASRNRFNNVKTNTFGANRWPSGMSHGGRGEVDEASRNRFNNVKTNTWPSGMSHGGLAEVDGGASRAKFDD